MTTSRRALLPTRPASMLAAFLLASTACGSDTAPRRMTGTYVTRTANGSPLPVHTCTSFLSESTFVTGASLEFFGRDSVRFTDVLRVTPYPDEFGVVDERRYAVRGQAVLLFPPGVTGRDAAPYDSLLIRGEALRRTIRCNVGPPTEPITFEYLPAP